MTKSPGDQRRFEGGVGSSWAILNWKTHERSGGDAMRVGLGGAATRAWSCSGYALVAGGVMGRCTAGLALSDVSFSAHPSQPGRRRTAAERMAVEVTRIVEERCARSPASVGPLTPAAAVRKCRFTFDWGEDMTAAFFRPRRRSTAFGPVPQGTSFEVRRMDPTVFRSSPIASRSKSRPLRTARPGQYQLRPVLSTIAGVAKIDVQGGRWRNIALVVDPESCGPEAWNQRCHRRRLGGQRAGGVDASRTCSMLYLIVTDTRFKIDEEIGATVIHSGPAE